jgi:hypothetical protein
LVPPKGIVRRSFNGGATADNTGGSEFFVAGVYPKYNSSMSVSTTTATAKTKAVRKTIEDLF